jgi:dTDP-4-amino-4,6-dideoxygalactose transaminase
MNRLVYRWTSPQLSDEGRSLLDMVINSGQWSYGPIARSVEREISTQLSVPHVLLTNSGTSALWILLSMARRKDKQQAVILPAFGYSAAANIAASLGYEIYAAESREDAPVIDPRSVEKLIDDNVAFIIGINYFGYSVDWDKIPALCKISSTDLMMSRRLSLASLKCPIVSLKKQAATSVISMFMPGISV